MALFEADGASILIRKPGDTVEIEGGLEMLDDTFGCWMRW